MFCYNCIHNASSNHRWSPLRTYVWGFGGWRWPDIYIYMWVCMCISKINIYVLTDIILMLLIDWGATVRIDVDYVPQSLEKPKKCKLCLDLFCNPIPWHLKSYNLSQSLSPLSPPSMAPMNYCKTFIGPFNLKTTSKLICWMHTKWLGYLLIQSVKFHGW